MLHEEFNSTRDVVEKDYFEKRVPAFVTENLTERAELREYQKEAIGRFAYYLTKYPKKKKPTHLLFNMATGSGKTLIMAADILYLYEKGYRNFIFFVNSTNIIEKTKENFLNPYSNKFLFAKNLKFGDKAVKITPVENFETVNPEDINILFTTTQGLHTRLANPKENAITYEDFAEKKIVLLSDEAHHINTLTKLKKNGQKSLLDDGIGKIEGLKKEEETELRSWEGTVMRILNADKNNILLEFTATIDLKNPGIAEKYEDKIIFEYNLKQYRLDGFSKEIEILEADLSRMDRALVAIILSQYRMKVAQKHRIFLKPVVMFKANRVSVPKKTNAEAVVSSEFKEEFLDKVKNLKSDDLKRLGKIKNETLRRAFEFFKNNGIALGALARELQNDFTEEKCISIDSKDQSEKNQILVNSLEDPSNEVRAVFAVDALNEGWDVLNLFDIVRLYNSREHRPGSYTMAEAQLIGRGARYYPFATKEKSDRYCRKFDEDVENELRIIEQLYYHSAQYSGYISDITNALVQTGIMPEKKVEREVKVKDSFKNTALWKNGIIFLNSQIPDDRAGVKNLKSVDIPLEYEYDFVTGFIEEHEVLSDKLQMKTQAGNVEMRRIKLLSLSRGVAREAIDRIDFYNFKNIQKYFPPADSVEKFIDEYLKDVSVKVSSQKDFLDSLRQEEKLDIAVNVLEQIAVSAQITKKENKGSFEFGAHKISDIFKDKILQIASDSPRAKEMAEIDLSARSWFAQNEIWGTGEEELFLKFFDETVDGLNKKYDQVAVMRNERHFKIFNFEDGQPFEPDFVLFLKEKKTKKELLWQVFIEPKGDQFLDEDGGFQKGKEGWKEKFLLQIADKYKLDLDKFKIENKDFKLIGLPFFNESLKEKFEKSFFELVK
ncbi:MAG: DEAD/DEAH box helicase family protein [Parcubacteria group bacterium]